VVLLLAIVVAWLGLVALWIAAIVSVTHFPPSAFQAADRSMGSTIALIIVTGWLGAIYYWLVIRRELEPYRDRDVAPGDGGLSTYA
jgi:hypothetical protein